MFSSRLRAETITSSSVVPPALAAAASAAWAGRAVATSPMAEAESSSRRSVRSDGRIEAAVANFESALALAPDHPATLDHLFHSLLAHSPDPPSRARALAAVTRALAVKETNAAKALFVDCVRNRKFTSDALGIRPLMLRALSEPWDRPADLADPAASLVKLSPAVMQCCARATAAWPTRLKIEDLAGRLAAIADDELLRVLLETVPVCDVELERCLTGIRAILLDAAGGPTATDRNLLRFNLHWHGNASSTNTYSMPPPRNSRRWSGCARCCAWLRRPPSHCLDDLGQLLPAAPLAPRICVLERAWSPAVGALLTQQVREPLEERLARDFIPHLTAIADDVSLKVKQQYEDHPYPRWVKPAPAGEPKTMPQYFGDWFRPRPELGRHDRTDILVAGCGTGQNLVETARDFKGALMLAVDLSLASLCYAKRQALALGLTNIAFGEADIRSEGWPNLRHGCQRRAPSHGRPWAGWRVLLRCCGPAASWVGLYSGSAPGRRCGARALIASAVTLPPRKTFDAADRISCSFRRELAQALPSI